MLTIYREDKSVQVLENFMKGFVPSPINIKSIVHDIAGPGATYKWQPFVS